MDSEPGFFEDPLPTVIFFVIILILLVVIFLWLFHKSVFAPSKKMSIVENIGKYRNFFIGTETGRSREDKKIKGENNINVRLYHDFPK